MKFHIRCISFFQLCKYFLKNLKLITSTQEHIIYMKGRTYNIYERYRVMIINDIKVNILPLYESLFIYLVK